MDAKIIRSPKHPRGRFTSATVTVIHPPLAEIEARAADAATWLASVRTSVPGWEQKPPRPRSSRAAVRRPAPPPIADIVVLPEPEVIRPRGDMGPVDDDTDVHF